MLQSTMPINWEWRRSIQPPSRIDGDLHRDRWSSVHQKLASTINKCAQNTGQSSPSCQEQVKAWTINFDRLEMEHRVKEMLKSFISTRSNTNSNKYYLCTNIYCGCLRKDETNCTSQLPNCFKKSTRWVQRQRFIPIEFGTHDMQDFFTMFLCCFQSA